MSRARKQTALTWIALGSSLGQGCAPLPMAENDYAKETTVVDDSTAAISNESTQPNRHSESAGPRDGLIGLQFAGNVVSESFVEGLIGREALSWKVVSGGEGSEQQRLLLVTVAVDGLSEFSTYFLTESSCPASGDTCISGYRLAGRIDTWIGFDADEGEARGQSEVFTVVLSELERPTRAGGWRSSAIRDNFPRISEVGRLERAGRITFKFDAAGSFDFGAFDATGALLSSTSAIPDLSDAAREKLCTGALTTVAGGLTAASAALTGSSFGLAFSGALASVAFATESAGLLAASAAVALTPGVGQAMAGVVFGVAFMSAAIMAADYYCTARVNSDGDRVIDLPPEAGSGDNCMVVYVYESVPYDCGYQSGEYDEATATYTVVWHSEICWLHRVVSAQVICP